MPSLALRELTMGKEMEVGPHPSRITLSVRLSHWTFPVIILPLKRRILHFIAPSGMGLHPQFPQLDHYSPQSHNSTPILLFSHLCPYHFYSLDNSNVFRTTLVALRINT